LDRVVVQFAEYQVLEIFNLDIREPLVLARFGVVRCYFPQCKSDRVNKMDVVQWNVLPPTRHVHDRLVEL
jgi:hypothetical protein